MAASYPPRFTTDLAVFLMGNPKDFLSIMTYSPRKQYFVSAPSISACVLNFRVGMGATTNLLTKIKCFLLTGEVVLHPILGALNKPSLRIVKKKYSSLPFAFTGILPLPGHSRFVKIYLIRQSLTAFCFSLRPPSSGYSCIRHYLLVPYGF